MNSRRFIGHPLRLKTISRAVTWRASHGDRSLMSGRVKTSSALVGHKISALPPKPDFCALMSTRPSAQTATLLAVQRTRLQTPVTAAPLPSREP